MACLQKAANHMYDVTDFDQSLVSSLLALKVSPLALCDLQVGFGNDFLGRGMGNRSGG